MLVIIAAMLLVGASAPDGPSFNTGNEIYATCTSTAQDDFYACYGYITGFLGGADAAMLAGGGKLTICLPPKVTNGQLHDVLVKWLQDHPDLRHLDGAVLTMTAFHTAFPCKE